MVAGEWENKNPWSSHICLWGKKIGAVATLGAGLGGQGVGPRWQLGASSAEGIRRKTS
jgi:hypothetical protein